MASQPGMAKVRGWRAFVASHHDIVHMAACERHGMIEPCKSFRKNSSIRRTWRSSGGPPHRDGIELYRAHIVRHAFDPHTHEAYGLGAIESGVERFRYRGSEHLAPPDSLVMMNPDVLHTGRAETEGGWRYRMAYIDADIVEAATGERGWQFSDAVHHDVARARRVSTLLDRLWLANEPLAFDSLLLTLLQRVSQPGARRPCRPRAKAPRASSRVDRLSAREPGRAPDARSSWRTVAGPQSVPLPAQFPGAASRHAAADVDGAAAVRREAAADARRGAGRGGRGCPGWPTRRI